MFVLCFRFRSMSWRNTRLKHGEVIVYSFEDTYVIHTHVMCLSSSCICSLFQRSISSILSSPWSASHLTPGKAGPLQHFLFLLSFQWQSCVSCWQPLRSHLFLAEEQDSPATRHRSRIRERPPHTHPQTHPQVPAHLRKSLCYTFDITIH